ncbi:divergent polysaccharide deacetylase family protein [Desulfuromonas thiophila]|uniref:Divergent polysaccharide deacetylase n=1 Tax=Desulfuromonas thiophila TaxID=57664 RepID=A0A1G7AUX7_9BACT|nr:divergent polysaccharide deacetylase family protein [Desulfuromonas thiophila]SDE18603.1 hypothetical protein SAMN05661003_104210 [Desulfuromonas thiophila]
MSSPNKNKPKKSRASRRRRKSRLLRRWTPTRLSLAVILLLTAVLLAILLWLAGRPQPARHSVPTPAAPVITPVRPFIAPPPASPAVVIPPPATVPAPVLSPWPEEPPASEIEPPPDPAQLPLAPATPATQVIKPPPATPPLVLPSRGSTPVRLAIIMDDVGENLQRARQVLALNLPVTLSIIPGLSHSRTIMELAQRQGHEVMVHLPMEPLGYPQTDPGPGALLLSLDGTEIRHRTRAFLSQLPAATGCNNHMGSAFTQDAACMQAALEEIARAGLFFIDSLTSPASVAADQARQLGIATARRDVFLDNVQDVAAISRQLDQLLRRARQQGQAIGICHPHKETVLALQAFARQVRHSDIEVVPASALVH